MEPNTQQPTPATNKPVMDVVPPPKSTAPVPTDDVKTPPASDPAPAAETTDEKDQAKEAKQKVVKPRKAPQNGAGLAIAATVIIVLGLAALFVYAYLRTNGITVF